MEEDDIRSFQRDYLAGQVVIGLTASNSTWVREPERLAELCYRIADAMLKEGAKKK